MAILAFWPNAHAACVRSQFKTKKSVLRKVYFFRKAGLSRDPRLLVKQKAFAREDPYSPQVPGPHGRLSSMNDLEKSFRYCAKTESVAWRNRHVI